MLACYAWNRWTIVLTLFDFDSDSDMISDLFWRLLLQAVSSEGFLCLLAAVLCVSEACLQQCKRVRGLLEEGLKAGRMPRTQWAPLLLGMQEAAQAVSEVSHGRFAKLLASR